MPQKTTDYYLQLIDRLLSEFQHITLGKLDLWLGINRSGVMELADIWRHEASRANPSPLAASVKVNLIEFFSQVDPNFLMKTGYATDTGRECYATDTGRESKIMDMFKWFNTVLLQEKGFAVIQSILLLEEMREFILEEQSQEKYQTDLAPTLLVAVIEGLDKLIEGLVATHYDAVETRKPEFEERVEEIRNKFQGMKSYLLSVR